MRGDPVQHDARCNRVEVPSNRGEGTRDNLSIKVCFVHCRLQGRCGERLETSSRGRHA